MPRQPTSSFSLSSFRLHIFVRSGSDLVFAGSERLCVPLDTPVWEHDKHAFRTVDHVQHSSDEDEDEGEGKGEDQDEDEHKFAWHGFFVPDCLEVFTHNAA